MDVQGWTFLIVGVTFALYIGIAIATRARSTGEFYVAGKGVSPLANGMATAADWMSAASFISMAGIIAFAGMDGSVYLMGWTGGYVLLALLLDCRIVLTEGRFVDAAGFEILDEGKAVRPLEIDTEEAKNNHRPVTLSLTWTTADGRPAPVDR